VIARNRNVIAVIGSVGLMRGWPWAAAFLVVVLSSLGTAAAQPAARPSQAQESAAASPELAQQVRSEFLHAWSGYKQYAWGHDELTPLSHGYRDWYGTSLYMTPVDALDTMLLMGLTKEAGEARELIVNNLSFDKDIEVKNFEITIRLLGGLLSSYQLTGDKQLLVLAEDLGNRLLPAFDSPTGMPYVYVNLKTGKTRGAESNPAEIGTLLIEFGTLSRLTGKPVFYDKAKRALVEVYKRRSKNGLVGSVINVETGAWTNTTSHISGGIDSYYEYLLKAWLLFDDRDCERMWKASLKAVNQYLADELNGGLWYARVDMNTGKRNARRYGSLDAFFPATLVRAGDLAHARRFQESAYKVWTTFGVEPEEVDYQKLKIVEDGYHLRPEIMESSYYLYFYTQDPRYRQMSATFFNDLLRACRTDAGYAALSSVTSLQQSDRMESYFLAETLKYLYLTFAPRQTLDLNKVVFNTEAHPMRRTW
jgi:mannosidase alpha-like ER degradation enhancer 2